MPNGSRRSMSFLSASAIQFASRYLNVGLQLVLTAVLARLLTPEEYGVMAGVTTFTALFAILADLGFGPAIIQFKDLNGRDYGGIFIFSIGIGIILSVIFALLAHPIAWFFRDDAYINLCFLAIISIFFNAVNMVPNGLLLKDKKFLSIGIRLIVSTLFGGAVAIFLAYRGFGTASLIWNLNITAIIIFIWNYISIRKQMQFRELHIFKSVRKVLRYSLYQAGFGLVNYFSRNTDHLVIGRFLGASPLGLYDKAYRLTSYPIQFVPGILSSVLQPYLSAYQNDKERLFHYQMLLVRFLSLAGSLFMFICILCGGDLVNIMYGPQWTASTPLFMILAGSIVFQMVMNVTGGILQSAGRTDLLFRQGIAATVIMLVLVLAGTVGQNLYILTSCVSVAFFFQLFTVAYYTSVKAFGHSMRDFLYPVFRVIGISTLIALPELFIRYYLGFTLQNSFTNLLTYSLPYVFLFFVTFYLTGDLRTLLQVVRRRS